MIEQIVELFKDESFRHWLFWTAVTITILGGYPRFIKIYKRPYK